MSFDEYKHSQKYYFFEFQKKNFKNIPYGGFMTHTAGISATRIFLRLASCTRWAKVIICYVYTYKYGTNRTSECYSILALYYTGQNLLISKHFI